MFNFGFSYVGLIYLLMLFSNPSDKALKELKQSHAFKTYC